MSGIKDIKKIFGGGSSNVRQFTILAALIVIIVIFQIWTGGLTLTPGNLINLVSQYSYILILAIGMVMLIIAGHIDLGLAGRLLLGLGLGGGLPTGRRLRFTLLLARRLQLAVAGDHLQEVDAENELGDQIDGNQQNDGLQAEAAAAAAHRHLESTALTAARKAEAAALAAAILDVVAGPFIVESHVVLASCPMVPGLRR